MKLPSCLRVGAIGPVSVLLFLSISAASDASDTEDANYLVSRDVVYGDRSKPEHQFQNLDVYWKDATRQRPVIIYVHGGGWAFGDKSDVHLKPQFFAVHDMSFISMNYRLRWEYDLYDQLEDIANVIGWVKKNNAEYGLDPNRIVLMGHGAGAHLVSLIGTDANILKARDLKLSDIKAVVAIDTPSFDIPRLMKGTGSFMQQRRHRLVFGEDEKVWQAASPASHVDKDKAIPPFALLYVADSESTSIQARSFSRLLRDSGVNVIMIPGNQKTTQTIDEELGTAGDAPTLALMAFLRATI